MTNLKIFRATSLGLACGVLLMGGCDSSKPSSDVTVGGAAEDPTVEAFDKGSLNAESTPAKPGSNR